MKKILSFVWKFKFIFLIAIAVLGTGGYFGWKALFPKTEAVRYVTAKAALGDLVSSISGTGQVSAATQMDIKPKVSGDVALIAAKAGQEMKAGELIVQLDATEAKKTLRDAQTALKTAELELEELLSPPEEIELLQAEGAVVSAKNNLEELLSPPDELELLKAENSLSSAKESLEKLKVTQADEYRNATEAIRKAEDNLNKAYEDAFNTASNAFLDLPTIMTGLNGILYSYDIAKAEASVSYSQNVDVLKGVIPYSDSENQNKFDELAQSAKDNYAAAKTAYDKNFENYKNASRYSERAVIEALVDETVETVKKMAEAAKSESNLLDFWVDYRTDQDLRVFAKVTSYQTDLKTYTSKTSSHLSGLLSDQKTIADDQDAKVDAERDLEEVNRNQPVELAAAERSVTEKEKALVDLKAGADQIEIDSARRTLKEKELSLADLKAGADELSIRAKNLAVQQKEDALADAQENLANHSIYAPFDGIITEVSVEKGDSVSSGTALASFITKQKIAEISLNEIEAVKVKAGQAVTLTFDAIDGLTLAGQVEEVDTIGTVSQGVVSYNVKISFDDPEEQIKPGMSVNTEIIIESKQNVLTIPAGAIQTMRENNFVRILVEGRPKMQPVTVGTSNDIMTEITEGLEEGDLIITQTVSANGNGSSNGNSTGGSSTSNGSRNQNFGPPDGGGMEIMRMIR